MNSHNFHSGHYGFFAISCYLKYSRFYTQRPYFKDYDILMPGALSSGVETIRLNSFEMLNKISELKPSRFFITHKNVHYEKSFDKDRVEWALLYHWEYLCPSISIDIQWLLILQSHWNISQRILWSKSFVTVCKHLVYSNTLLMLRIDKESQVKISNNLDWILSSFQCNLKFLEEDFWISPFQDTFRLLLERLNNA